MSSKIRPLHDRIILKQKKESEMSAGGIFIPTSHQEKPLEGEVLAVGSGKVLENGTTIKPSVKVGDVVLFGKHSFQEVKVDGENYLIIKEDNVLGIIESSQ
jgi:chaperonin GroES